MVAEALGRGVGEGLADGVGVGLEGDGEGELAPGVEVALDEGVPVTLGRGVGVARLPAPADASWEAPTTPPPEELPPPALAASSDGRAAGRGSAEPPAELPFSSVDEALFASTERSPPLSEKAPRKGQSASAAAPALRGGGGRAVPPCPGAGGSWNAVPQASSPPNITPADQRRYLTTPPSIAPCQEKRSGAFEGRSNHAKGASPHTKATKVHWSPCPIALRQGQAIRAQPEPIESGRWTAPDDKGDNRRFPPPFETL